MALGKGLESLIPPKKSDDSSTPILPQGEVSQAISPPASEPLLPPPGESVGGGVGGGGLEDAHQGKGQAVFHIEVDSIKPNPHQPRRVFDEEGLRELASSIREFGVIQPIVVSKVETELDNGTRVEYELIAGERRLLASKLTGLRTIPAIVRSMTPEREKLELAIIENIQRKDLNPIEQAKAFARLQDEFRLTQREIAAKLGKSRESVANSVRLLNLPSDIQDAVASGKINESHARLLLSVPDIAEQKRIFEEILTGKVSVRQARLKVAKAQPKAPQTLFVRPEFIAIKDTLEDLFGTKVELQEEGERGRITINFYSKEELDAIIRKLVNRGGSEPL